jgi:hypothetical protein
MDSQGEETVYDARPMLGKFCLFNGRLAVVNGCEKTVLLDARKSLRNDRNSVLGDGLNALG